MKLRFRPEVAETERARVVQELCARIGSPVFAVEGLGEPGGSLELVTGRALAERGQTLALAEDASGGHLAALCSLVIGEGQWLTGGTVCALPGGEDAALAAAERARSTWSADFGLATGSLQGDPPDQGAIALVGEGVREARLVRYFGGAERQQGLAAGAALDLLRRHLLGDRSTGAR